MLTCSSCLVKRPESNFINDIGKQYATCSKCRTKKRNNKSEKQLEQSKNWKIQNAEYVSYMNSIYNKTKHLDKVERAKIIEKYKEEYGFKNKTI